MNYVIKGTFVTSQVKTFTCQVIKGTLKSVITTQIPSLKLNPSSVYVVVILFILFFFISRYFWFSFAFGYVDVR